MFILSAALALSSVLSPFNALVDHHAPARQKDQRVSFVIHNVSLIRFDYLKIDGQTYTVPAHGAIAVKAPTGTVIFANSQFSRFHRGDVLLTVTPELSDSIIDLQ